MKVSGLLFAFLLAGAVHHAALADDFDWCSMNTDQDQCQSDPDECAWADPSCSPADGGNDIYGCWANDDQNSCEEDFDSECSWNDGYCYSTGFDVAKRPLLKKNKSNKSVNR